MTDRGLVLKGFRTTSGLACRASAFTLATATALAAGTAAAQERRAGDGGWTFSVTPYLWAAGLDGSSRLGRLPSTDISADLGEILENLDIALMGTAEARHDRFSLFADLVYVSLSDSSATPGPAFSKARIEIESLFMTLGGGYAVLQTDNATVDVNLAGRYWLQSNELSLSAGALPARGAEVTEVWIDPMIGLAGRYTFDSRVFVAGRAMAGGFGVGSDIAFDGVASIGYVFNDRFAASIGYRWVSVDYDDDDFAYDIDQHGPIAGLRISF